MRQKNLGLQARLIKGHSADVPSSCKESGRSIKSFELILLARTAS
jgi:hypothetical protein